MGIKAMIKSNEFWEKPFEFFASSTMLRYHRDVMLTGNPYEIKKSKINLYVCLN